MLPRYIRWGGRLLWMSLILSVIYIWSGHLLARLIPHQREGIEYWLTQRLSTPVSIGSIQLEGHLLALNIVLRDIRVMSIDTTRAPLTMKLCWIGVDGIASLRHRQLRLRFLKLTGLNAFAWQNDQRQWRMSGLDGLQNILAKPLSPTPSLRTERMHQSLVWLDSLIAQRGLIFDDINLQLDASRLTPNWIKILYGNVDAGRVLTPQKIWMQRLSFYKEAQQYQLFSQVTLLKNSPVSLMLNARISGQSLLPETWQANAYMKLDPTDMKPWIGPHLPATFTVDSLRGQAEAWVTLQAGRLRQLKGHVELDQARIRYQYRGYRLDHWQGSFDAQYHHQSQWSLVLHPTNWHVADQQWTLPAIRVDQQSEPNQAAVRSVQLAKIDIETLHQLANAISQFEPLKAALVPSVSRLLVPHPSPQLITPSLEFLFKQLYQYSPRGQMKDITWMQTESEQKWQMRLADIAFNPQKSWPGGSGFNAVVTGRRFRASNYQQTNYQQTNHQQTSHQQTSHHQTRYHQTQVVAQLDSPNLIVDWPRVFQKTLPAIHAKGQVILLRDRSQWELKIPFIQLENKDAVADGLAVVVKDTDDAPRLQLQAQIRQAKTKVAGKYLPTKIMDPGFVRWLQTAVLDGDIEQADFLIQGRLRKTGEPLAKSLLMRYQFNNAVIDFLPPWPRLEQAQGHVDVDGKRAQVMLQRGKILDAQILPSQLSIENIKNQLRLKLQVEAEGSAQTGLAVLAQSPLHGKLAGLLAAINGQGPAKYHLQLDAPLGVPVPSTVTSPQTATRFPTATRSATSTSSVTATTPQLRPLWVNVRTEFEKVNVDFPLLKLSAKNFSGELTYDSVKGISIPNWQAVLFDHPVEGRTYTKSNTNGSAIISYFSGNMSLKAVNEWVQHPLLAYASGATQYKAQLVLTPFQQMQDALLQINSNLSGVTIPLPLPLELDGKKTVSFQYRQQLDPLKPAIDIQYGSRLRFIKQKNAMGIYFGDEKNNFYGQTLPSGVTISGTLPRVDLQQWMTIVADHKNNVNNQPKAQSIEIPKVRTSERNAKNFSWSDDLIMQLRALNLSFSNLYWKNVELGRAHLQMIPSQDNWKVAIKSLKVDAEAKIPSVFIRHWAEKGFTKISASTLDQLISLNIDRLQLPLANQVQTSPIQTSPVTQSLNTVLSSVMVTPPPISNAPHFSPESVPPMQLSIDQIMNQGKVLGNLQARIQPSTEGIFFHDIRAKFKEVNLQGKGEWRWLPTVGLASTNSVLQPQSSQFIGQVSTENMVGFLSAWEYPAVIDAKIAKLDVELSWPGNPADVVLSRMTGAVNVKMNNGRLLKVDNTTASVRVAGIMNFETIIRRMQLDFSDLLKKGLAFDEIKGHFELADAKMRTDNFVLKGPAATFKIRGDADLSRRQLDHQLTVTLPVSRNLVLPAAATGGLPAAATAFLIEQAIGDRLDKLTELTYSMQGSWQDPKIERR